MGGFSDFLESRDGGDLFGGGRVPMSGRMRRKIGLTGPREDGTIGDLGKSADWEPTHRSKVVDGLECMVTQETPTVVHFITSYGGKGSDPAEVFAAHWEAIPSPGLN